MHVCFFISAPVASLTCRFFSPVSIKSQARRHRCVKPCPLHSRILLHMRGCLFPLFSGTKGGVPQITFVKKHHQARCELGNLLLFFSPASLQQEILGPPLLQEKGFKRPVFNLREAAKLSHLHPKHGLLRSEYSHSQQTAK